MISCLHHASVILQMVACCEYYMYLLNGSAFEQEVPLIFNHCSVICRHW